MLSSLLYRGIRYIRHTVYNILTFHGMCALITKTNGNLLSDLLYLIVNLSNFLTYMKLQKQRQSGDAEISASASRYIRMCSIKSPGWPVVDLCQTN